MAVDKDFYTNVYGGGEFSDIDRLLIRAERAIECLIVTDPVTEREQNYFNLAVCAQAEYMGLCGGVEAWAVSVSGTAASFSVGSFSMSQGGSSGERNGAASLGICSRAESYLDRAGLLYRGCAVC